MEDRLVARARSTVAGRPVFGYILDSDVFASGDSVPSSRFPGGSAGVEAEIAIWIGRDLPGPAHTRADVEAAVSRIAPAIELVSARLPDPHPREHAIADNVYHAGVVLGDGLDDASAVDFFTEEGRVLVNGEPIGQGMTRTIMGRDPIEAVVWLANELPKHDSSLRAGDVVVTGTVVTPPPVGPGDRARVEFATLGAVEVEIER